MCIVLVHFLEAWVIADDEAVEQAVDDGGKANAQAPRVARQRLLAVI